MLPLSYLPVRLARTILFIGYAVCLLQHPRIASYIATVYPEGDENDRLYSTKNRAQDVFLDPQASTKIFWPSQPKATMSRDSGGDFEDEKKASRPKSSNFAHLQLPRPASGSLEFKRRSPAGQSLVNSFQFGGHRPQSSRTGELTRGHGHGVSTSAVPGSVGSGSPRFAHRHLKSRNLASSRRVSTIHSFSSQVSQFLRDI